MLISDKSQEIEKEAYGDERSDSHECLGKGG
jgi:hypothetical protein